jgi:hypothetical protein
LTTKFDPADYDHFSYDGYATSADGAEFRAYYSLGWPSSRLTFLENVRPPGQDVPTRPPSNRTARLLALTAGLSYYKARHFVPPRFHGALDALA